MKKKYILTPFFLLTAFGLFSQIFKTNPIDSDFGFARGIKVADLDNDANLDIVSFRIGDLVEVACWFGDGSGSFGNKVVIYESLDAPIDNLGDDINVLDINNDGFLDVVAATQFRSDENDPFSAWHHLLWWPNNQDRTFGPTVIIEENVGRTSNSILVFDIDNNTYDDIVIGDNLSGDDVLSYWSNNGSGSIALRQTIDNIDVIAAHDVLLDGDDFKDIIITSGGGGNGPRIASFLNNQDGTFNGPISIDDEFPARYVTSGNINNDAHIDILVSGLSDESSLAWYAGQADGSFGPRNTILVNDNEIINGVETFLADIDNDGDEDAIMVAFSPYDISWWPNDGQGNFGARILIDNTFDVGYGIEVADLNEDGIADIVGTNQTGIYWFENIDLDSDGVPNDVDLCPNTPIDARVDVDGCEVFSLPSTNFSVLIAGESCRSSDNGSISISAQEPFDYTATLTGNGVNDSGTFTETISFSNLSAGDYRICIVVDNQANYEQCFDFSITQPEDLSVSSKVDVQNDKVALELSGGEWYIITINNRVFETEESEIRIDLFEGTNKLKVQTNKDCQGVYEEVIVLGKEVMLFPNPTRGGQMTLHLGKFDDTSIAVEIFTISGQTISNKIYKVNNRNVQLNISELPSGIYLAKVKAGEKTLSYKIVKE